MPALGTNCTAVGFGRYDEGTFHYSGIKRSATVRVASTGVNIDDPRIITKWVTGGTFTGDSGSPLVCGNDIVGILSSGPISWPYNTTTAKFSYTAIHLGWILESIGIAPPPVTNSLHVTQDSQLYRVANRIGNSSRISDSTVDWTDTHAIASLNGTLYAIEVAVTRPCDYAVPARSQSRTKEPRGPPPAASEG